MKTLQLYLTRQVLATLLMTVAVFTFVLLLGNLLQEVLGLLFSRQATLGAFLQALALLVPFVLVYALPMGLLTAALLTFGRFSADQELTAARAGGISLVSLVTPLLLLSVFLSGVCALINMEFAPRSRVAYKRILANVLVAQPSAMLRENTFLQFDLDKNKDTHEPAGRVIIFAGKISGTNLTDVLFCELDPQGKERRFSRAARGRVTVDRAGNKLLLVLQEVWTYQDDRPIYGEESELPPFKLPSETDQKLSLSNMTFTQLLAEQRDLERRLADSAPGARVTRERMAEEMQRLAQLRDELTLPVKVQLHRQVSFSFACVGFMLVGIPLGIRAHRRETSAGIAMAIVLVILYYSFFILGQSLETRPEFFPHLILWVPNFLFQSVGGVLLWRANRGV